MDDIIVMEKDRLERLNALVRTGRFQDLSQAFDKAISLLLEKEH